MQDALLSSCPYLYSTILHNQGSSYLRPTSIRRKAVTTCRCCLPWSWEPELPEIGLERGKASPPLHTRFRVNFQPCRLAQLWGIWKSGLGNGVGALQKLIDSSSSPREVSKPGLGTRTSISFFHVSGLCIGATQLFGYPAESPDCHLAPGL